MMSGSATAIGGQRTGRREILRVLRGHGRRIGLASALALAGSALALVQPLLVKRVIEAAGQGSGTGGAIGLLIALFLAPAAVEAVARHATRSRAPTKGSYWGCDSTSSAICCDCPCARTTGIGPET